MMEHIIIGFLFTVISGLITTIWVMHSKRMDAIDVKIDAVNDNCKKRADRFLDKVAIIDGELNGKEGIYVDLTNIKKDIQHLQEKNNE